jgi:hypothetical protein
MGVGTFETYNKGDNVYFVDGERMTYPDSGPTGTAPPERTLAAARLRGLSAAQLAVGLTHRARGNPVGAARLGDVERHRLVAAGAGIPALADLFGFAHSMLLLVDEDGRPVARPVDNLRVGDRVAVLRKGVLQQIDTPRKLYETPVNLFVAGFIGSPAMNFLPGTLEDGHLRTALGDVALPAEMAAKVRRAGAGRDLIIGIRPEHFEDAALVEGRRAEGLTFKATVDVLESLGADKYAYFRLQGARATAQELEELAADAGTGDAPGGSDQVVARLDPASRAREGQQLELWFDPSKLHLFNPGNGAHLTL